MRSGPQRDRPTVRWSCGHLLHDINKHGSFPYLRPIYFHYASTETLNRRPKDLSSPHPPTLAIASVYIK